MSSVDDYAVFTCALYLGTVTGAAYLGTVTAVAYLGTVTGAAYLGTVTAVAYLGTVPAVAYLGIVTTIYLYRINVYILGAVFSLTHSTQALIKPGKPSSAFILILVEHVLSLSLRSIFPPCSTVAYLDMLPLSSTNG